MFDNDLPLAPETPAIRSPYEKSLCSYKGPGNEHTDYPEPKCRTFSCGQHYRTQSRPLRARQVLSQISAGSSEAVIRSLMAYAPRLAHMTVEFAYGDVFITEAIILKQRELSTVAILTALGNARPQLKVHIDAAFNVGLTREEIMETIINSAVYAGFPTAINGVMAMKEVEEERAGRNAKETEVRSE
jgi:4-carboxymuconolactone decarboxylase